MSTRTSHEVSHVLRQYATQRDCHQKNNTQKNSVIISYIMLVVTIDERYHQRSVQQSKTPHPEPAPNWGLGRDLQFVSHQIPIRPVKKP